MFVLQKLIWFLAMPPASLILLILLGMLVTAKWKRTGKILMFSGLLLFYLLSLPSVADLIIRPLEGAAPPLVHLPATADAVVVPGGGSIDLAWMGAAPVPNSETYTRLVKGIEIAKKMQIPLVLTGGNGEPFATKLNDADVMADAAYAMGMPKNEIIVENHSRNTLENSYAVRNIIKGNRIILATSAYYMKRARAMFAKRGFEVVPASTYYLAQSRKFGPAMLIPSADSLVRSKIALAEWMSIAWWKLRGEI